MLAECPERSSQRNRYNNNFNNYEVGLFTGNDKDELVLLLHESWNSAILDSGCSSNVCGKKWIDDIISKLNIEEHEVTRGSSVKVFNFGGGEKLNSLGTVTFPCLLAGKNINITTDIVSSNLPLLLSIKTMKDFGMVWDFQKGSVNIFDREITLDVSSCGHHSIPILPSEVSVEECAMVAKHDLSDEEFMNRKLKFLHLTFAHPPKDKFISLLRDANVWSDNFEKTIEEIYNKCETCEVFSKTPSRPVVAMPEAREFGELVVMDLKQWGNGYILHMIDAFSRFSISVAIKHKTPQTVAQHFLVNWVGAGYGLCKKLKFDNGGEFSNNEMRELTDCLGIEVDTTAARSPWQNGLCERNHAVTDRCLEKILDENPDIALDVALAYACNAKNSLQMWNGYSSYQIVFGSNPKVPDIFHATLPQLEGVSQSELLVRHMNAQQSARRGFIESQCDEKIRRALRHQVRCHLEVYGTGDKVYFKRDDSNRWRGPGTVIGQDRQVVFVRHGGVFVRVPTCRLKKVKPGIELTADHQDEESAEQEEEPAEQSVTQDEQLDDQQYEVIGHNEEETIDRQDEGENERPSLKRGDHIKFRHEEEDEWHTVEVTSSAGKKTGKNKNWYNVKEGDDEYSLDITRTKDLQIEKQNETVNVVMVPRVDHGKAEIKKAKEKELEGWKEMDAYQEVPDVGQYRIKSMWVITKKDKGYKARLVVRGDLEHCNVQGDSPTISKLAIRIFLAVAASEGFKISTKDVRSAFLQGKYLERTVYVDPPNEMKKPFTIWKLNKAVYGLEDAARKWYESVLQEMLKIGCTKSKFEAALFYFKKNDKLMGMSATHVDDFLNCGNQVFDQAVTEKINRKFQFGSAYDIDFRYVGINIKQENNFINVDQKHYIDNLNEVKIDTKHNDRLLSEKEKTEFRGLVGSLNWVSLISRPDVSFEVVDLSTKFQAPIVADMVTANKAVRKIKNSYTNLKFSQLTINENMKIVVYSDGSFRNLCRGVSSGSGRIILLVDEHRRCCVLTWTSNKLKKVVDSTLAAESLSLVNAIKEAVYVQHIMKELIGDRASLPIYCVVDSQGTQDAVYSTKLVEDRLTRLYIAAIKEHLESRAIEKVIHVRGEWMLADSLTKRGAPNRLLLEVLRDGVLPEQPIF